MSFTETGHDTDILLAHDDTIHGGLFAATRMCRDTCWEQKAWWVDLGEHTSFGDATPAGEIWGETLVKPAEFSENDAA